MTEDEFDAIFMALANAHRRRILDLVGGEPGISVGRLARHFDVSRIAVMNHLATLERAKLVLSERVGTTRKLYLNVVPIQSIYERWTNEFGGYWAGQLLSIKSVAETAVRKGDENGSA